MSKRRIYAMEVQICATAYIRASGPKEAREIAARLADRSPKIEGWGGALRHDQGGDVPISGYKFEDPRLPALSLSPAMTIHGPWPGALVCPAGDA